MSRSVPAANVHEGTVTGVEEYVVDNNGEYFGLWVVNAATCAPTSQAAASTQRAASYAPGTGQSTT